MIKKNVISLSIIALILNLTFTSCSSDEVVNPNTPIDTKKLDALMEGFVARNPQLYGVVASIEQPNRISWKAAVGSSDITNQQEAKENHQFITASITKTFVATIVLQLAEEDKIRLDDAIDKYLPEEIVNNISIIDGRSRGSEITIRQLLSHKSGVYDYLEGGVFHIEGLATPNKRYTSEDRIRYAIEEGNPYFAPNQGVAYSNTNYALLELIIESATGEDLNTEFENRIFKPLGLTNTHFAYQDSKLDKLMQGYFKDENITAFTVNLDWASPDGGIISNTEDLQKFSKELFSGRMFQNMETLQEMLVFENGYGLGLELLVEDTKLGKIYGHTGATPGYTSIMAYVENLEATIVISGNQTEQYLDDGNYLINQFILTLFE